MSRCGDSFLSLLKLPLSLKSLDTAFKSLFWLVSYLTDGRGLMKRAIFRLNDI